MQVGTPLQAPNGFHCLEKGLNYYFLRSNRSTGLVQLVLFTFDGKRWLAHLHSLPREEFESALTQNLIVCAPDSQGIPPFLTGAQGRDLYQSDLARANAKVQHSQRAENRLLQISPLIDRAADILSSARPEKELNKYATTHGLNAQRVRFWFFAYACFGVRKDVLYPHYFNCGGWDRSARPHGDKWGRKSIARGVLAAKRLTDDDIKKIVDSYHRHKSAGKPLTVIYAQALKEDFDAVAHRDEAMGKLRLVSAKGNCIPTFDQYRYRLFKTLGPEAIRTLRWGQHRFRRSKASHKGSFSESVSNLLERVEADAYYCEDLPKSYFDTGAVSALAVTRIVDVASSMLIGIGFSYGKEDGQSYRSAQFCAAISKKKFGELFGMEISDEDWPAQGVPLQFITDRGPGISSGHAHSQNEGAGLIINELTPSAQGQSKAIVESAQRRRTKLEGPSILRESNLTITEMAVREIRRLILDNKTSDVGSRLTPDMVRADVVPTPNGIWNYLDSRARNDGYFMPFDEAVRTFLPATEVTVDRAGVMLKMQRYDSPALRSTGILDTVSTIGSQRLKAYVFPLSILYIWVEINGRLIEVKAKKSLNDDDEQYVRALVDLNAEAQKRKQMASELKVNKHAETIENLHRFEEDTGKTWHSKTPGRRTPVKRSKQNLDEDRLTRNLLTGTGD